MTTGQEEPVGADVKSVNLGKASEFPNNSARNFQFGRKPAILVRNPQGELHAFIAVCTHLGCTVQFSSEKEDIWCACHGGRYDLNSGKNMSGPPPKPLTPLKVATVKGDIIVSVA
ncbi:MAG: Rieske (2Fe-2S) protein [Vampirovibrionales bacterium]|nr:Rieske (2Fe-2S) protein [Vampirovibrionales bacterium]